MPKSQSCDGIVSKGIVKIIVPSFRTMVTCGVKRQVFSPEPNTFSGFPHSSSLSARCLCSFCCYFLGQAASHHPHWSCLNFYQFPYKFLCSFSCPFQSFPHTTARVIFFFLPNSFIPGPSGSSLLHASFL